MKRILLARPRGFCAGVERAIAIVEEALKRFGPPIYVRHEIVHNRRVVEGFRARGVVFVETLAEVPDGALVIFSAHGVAPSVREEAARRRLRVIDATCPLVTKVHVEVERHIAQGRFVVMIGHRGHPEVEGTLGHAPAGMAALVETKEDVARLAPPDPERIAFVTQTTLSVDETKEIIEALRHRFPKIVGPKREDICYATTNRQEAVKALARRCEAVIVVGSRNSSNSNRLRETAARAGAAAQLVDGPHELDWRPLEKAQAIGITAGASAPEEAVAEVVAALRAHWPKAKVQEFVHKEERVHFALPRELAA